MGQVLRVTFDRKDQLFKLLKVGKEEMEIEVNGQVYLLERKGLSWIVKGAAEGLTPQLAEAIAKTVVLRYRI